MKIICLSRRLGLILCVSSVIGLAACDQRGGGVQGRQRTTGEQVDDKTLSGEVRAALNKDAMKFPDIQVTAYRGVVQLSGFVDTSEQKHRAVEIAKNVPGVSKVEDSMTVKEARKP